ncbi:MULTISPECIES: competence/damage-inducible protein A [unclassified Sinorhizobium]|uniref:competence/damage-inducible protein A n=1 Tax=unclassified Sinorhizobium TaxID=2613772 RepID=UPI0024C3CA50|nr:MULTISPECIES: competence/damage-inducible protein A [unclassified Sinorhizobium]MDK1372910.1 competence/damage-inducible protein A [Sinorhizobium sp. 6-70]MDK1477534.1 competence/damage-inducible protein A [Sinorhizobium sp. 6-117]
MTTARIVTAAMLAIGDELLSGRTKDKNIGHLAEMLTMIGIDLREVRIVADNEKAIVGAVNALRGRYDHVFTSGGIGPTHDDITADAISRAFGVECVHDPEAMALLGAMYERRGMEFTDARRRMARMPVGATHISNPVSTAPGFRIANVYVMAGVPQVFQAMLDSLLPSLQTGTPVLSRTVRSPYGEGEIGGPLTEVQKKHPETSIGSYPKFDGKNFSTDIVIRARDAAVLAAAEVDVIAMIETIAGSR